MKIGNKKSGQVILETAIVLVSAAALAISSMLLFSNLNRNMVARLGKYRDSRIAAVNNPYSNNISPEAFLNYSPYIDIITQGGEYGAINIPGVDDIGGFDLDFFEDPRIAQAELLLNQADDIINSIIPYKMGIMFYDDLRGQEVTDMMDGDYISVDNAYSYLSGRSDIRSYILNNVTIEGVRHARDICAELLQDMSQYYWYTELSAPRAYDNIYEDMNGIDSDGDGFVGAIGLLQQVLDSPIEDGPFDPDLGCVSGDTSCIRRQDNNMSNRSQLQSTINAIKPTQAGFDILFYGTAGIDPGMIGRLKAAHLELTIAADNWDLWLLVYFRPWWIGKAIIALQPIAEAIAEAQAQPVSDNIATQIRRAYELLQPEVSYDDLIEARGILYFLSLDPETQSPVPILYNIIRDALSYLDQAVGGWADPVARERYLDLTREKLEVLYDIVTSV